MSNYILFFSYSVFLVSFLSPLETMPSPYTENQLWHLLNAESWAPYLNLHEGRSLEVHLPLSQLTAELHAEGVTPATADLDTEAVWSLVPKVWVLEPQVCA